MAIWIDDNFYKEDCDHNVAYSYMYLLANMLASKHRYFDTKKDYEEYASILAYDTYKRMSDPNKVRIKSVLNYMKSIMSFRRSSYNYNKRQKIIDPVYDAGWDPVAYVERCKESYESSRGDYLFRGVNDVLSHVCSLIKKNISSIYKVDKQMYKRLYISCMLSLLDRITLPNEYLNRLKTKIDISPSFNEVNYYKKYLNSESVILWHLDSSYSDLVKVILNKTNLELINSIKELSDDIKVSDSEFNNILVSGFVTGDRNEADY